MDDAGFDLEGVDDVFPLNAAQMGMLYHSEAEPGTGVYVGVLDCALPDDLDLARFKSAWDHVIARHDALRSVFVWRGVDDPLQVVMSECTVTWETPDADLPEADGALDRDYVEMVRKEGIDLTEAPAMRFILGRLPSGQRYFLWVCHHALIDDWSQALVLKEVEATYRGRTAHEGKAVSYGAFADWLGARDDDADNAFWQDHFSGFTTPTRLQLQRPLDQDHALRGMVETTLGHAASDALRKATNTRRVTLAAMATAVWAVAVHRMSGEDDVAFGLAVTQRPPELGDMDRAIGNFVTTLPTRQVLTDHDTLGTLVQHCQDFVLDAQPRSGISLPRLQEMTGQPTDTPLFETILSIKQDALAGLDEGQDALFRDPTIHFKSNFPFAMVLLPGDDIGLRVIFNPQVVTSDGAETAMRIFQSALIAAPEHFDTAPVDLPVMPASAEERARAGERGADPLPDFEPIADQILDHASRTPDAVALRSGTEAVTYGALATSANDIAQALIAAGYGPGTRIGLFLDRGADVPVAMLGCLLAGAAYVPFDAAFPQERLEQMMRSAELSAVITSQTHRAFVAKLGTDIIDVSPPAQAAPQPLPAVSADDVAYVMFTSGSTGQPKGVVVTHGNLAASTAARPLWYAQTPETFLLLSSHSFDSSVVGIYWTLANGGTLSIPSHDEARDVATMLDRIDAHAVTHLLCLPSVYQLMLDKGGDRLSGLETVIVAGEEATPDLIRQHQGANLSARLVNEYGPTEATVWCAACDITNTAVGAPVPIGGPIPGTTLLLRDAQGRTVPDGLPGELLVGGAGVAAGYFNREAESETAFRPDPTDANGRVYHTGDLVRRGADGQLIYVGRADEQVKLRGYRIELSEIESTLSVRQDIQEAAVAVHGAGAAAKLIAYVIANEDAPLSPDDLRSYCLRVLPDYMVPAQFILIDSMPRTPNGKIDRKALPAPHLSTHAPDLVEASTPTESVLAELWRTTLWLDRKIGVTEDFYDLGGHSLLAMRLVNEIEQTFDLRVPLSSLGRITTVQDQAALLEQIRRTPDGNVVSKPKSSTGNVPSVMAGLTDDEERTLRTLTGSWRAPAARPDFNTRVLNASGTLPPLFFCFLSEYAFTQLAEYLGPDQPVFGIRGVNAVVPVTGEEGFEANMRRAALTYLPEVLELAGEGPIYLGGYCQGATMALNLASLLTTLQRPVGTVITVEKTPPIVYPGHVDIMFTEDGFLNPYLQFEHPEEAWSRRYASHTFQMVPGEYGTAFRPPNVLKLAGAIRDRLAAAREAPPVVLPRAARAVSWVEANLPGTLRPSERVQVSVTLKNESALTWAPTRQSGLRVRARWVDETSPSGKAFADLATAIPAGQSTSVLVPISAPDSEGPHTLEFDLIEEGVAVFSKMGNAPMIKIANVRGAADSATDRQVQTEEIDEQVVTDTAQVWSSQAKTLAELTRITSRTAMASGAHLPENAAKDVQAATAETLRDLAAAQRRSGDVSQAERNLKAAIQMEPDNSVGLLELARLQIEQGRWLPALSPLLKARRTDQSGRKDADAMLALYFTPRGIARALRNRVSGRSNASRRGENQK